MTEAWNKVKKAFNFLTLTSFFEFIRILVALYFFYLSLLLLLLTSEFSIFIAFFLPSLIGIVSLFMSKREQALYPTCSQESF